MPHLEPHQDDILRARHAIAHYWPNQHDVPWQKELEDAIEGAALAIQNPQKHQLALHASSEFWGAIYSWANAVLEDAAHPIQDGASMAEYCAEDVTRKLEALRSCLPDARLPDAQQLRRDLYAMEDAILHTVKTPLPQVNHAGPSQTLRALFGPYMRSPD